MEVHAKNCYNFGEFGHYSISCPKYSTNKKRKSSSPSSSTAEITSTFPPINCRCGGGFCKIKFNPKTRQHFYCCPNTYEMHCGYFKWCNELKEHEIVHRRPSPYPCCSCGAGICRLETENTEGPDFGRKYFACRIKKTQGACNYRQWQDEYYQPTSSPTSPLYMEPMEEAPASMDSHTVVVKWFPRN